MADRLIITLSKQEKKWLAAFSKAKKQSIAETVRSAINALRQASENSKSDNIILATAGLWKHHKQKEDFADKVRNEWKKT